MSKPALPSPKPPEVLHDRDPDSVNDPAGRRFDRLLVDGNWRALVKGYALAAALRAEADEIATDSRAQLVRHAADEIESLILQNRKVLAGLACCLHYAETPGDFSTQEAFDMMEECAKLIEQAGGRA